MTIDHAKVFQELTKQAVVETGLHATVSGTGFCVCAAEGAFI
jgi:hypothetical protein